MIYLFSFLVFFYEHLGTLVLWVLLFLRKMWLFSLQIFFCYIILSYMFLKESNCKCIWHVTYDSVHVTLFHTAIRDFFFIFCYYFLWFGFSIFSSTISESSILISVVLNLLMDLANKLFSHTNKKIDTYFLESNFNKIILIFSLLYVGSYNIIIILLNFMSLIHQ